MALRRRQVADEPPDRATLRLAIISTPRAGNMWLRRQLVALYGLQERSAHTPDEVDWPSLPQACVLQLHWPRRRDFEQTLRRYGFRVLVLTRHPLDTLISILHFAQHEPATARWLDGAAGDESSIRDALPTSQAFRAYATGGRARKLLSISSQWQGHAVASIRYEDLVSSPIGELERVTGAVGVDAALTSAEVIQEVTFDRLKAEASNHHFWRGQSRQWRELLPADVALELARPYAKLLRRDGYAVEPDPSLTHAEAIARWQSRIAAQRPAVTTGTP